MPMPSSSPAPVRPAADASARTRVAVSATVGLAAFALVLLIGEGKLAPVVGWDAGAGFYLVWMWTSIWWLDPRATAQRAVREDPGKVIADVLLLSASVVSLVAVGVVLIKAGHSKGANKDLLVGLGILSVIIAWAVVHTVFTLRYTGLYYGDGAGGVGGGVDFNESEPPRYSDFAYVAFTIGMTFQVSDTDLQTKDIRRTALQHALLSYVFGAVIIATTINLIAGLTH